MTAKLLVTRKEYQVEIDGGYSFHIVCERDPEWGWLSTVSIGSRGYKTAESSVAALRHSVEALDGFLEDFDEGRDLASEVVEVPE